MSPGVMYFARMFYCQVTLLFKSLKFPIPWWWSSVSHIIMLGHCPCESIVITWLYSFSEPADMPPLTFTAKGGTFFSNSRGSKCHHKTRDNNSLENLHFTFPARDNNTQLFSYPHSRFKFMTVSCSSFPSEKHHQLFQKERRQKSEIN